MFLNVVVLAVALHVVSSFKVDPDVGDLAHWNGITLFPDFEISMSIWVSEFSATECNAVDISEDNDQILGINFAAHNLVVKLSSVNSQSAFPFTLFAYSTVLITQKKDQNIPNQYILTITVDEQTQIINNIPGESYTNYAVKAGRYLTGSTEQCEIYIKDFKLTTNLPVCTPAEDSWSSCSVSCGKGLRSRYENCQTPDEFESCDSGELCQAVSTCDACPTPPSGGFSMAPVSCQSNCPLTKLCNLINHRRSPMDPDPIYVCQNKQQNECMAHHDPNVFLFDSLAETNDMRSPYVIRNDIYGKANYLMTRTHINDPYKFEVSMITEGGTETHTQWNLHNDLSRVYEVYVTFKLKGASEEITIFMSVLENTVSEYYTEENGVKAWRNLTPRREVSFSYQNVNSVHVLEVYFGLVVKLYFYEKLTIRVPAYFDNLEGICGNNNQNRFDDFRLKNGKMLRMESEVYNGNNFWEIFSDSPVEKQVAVSWLIGKPEDARNRNRRSTEESNLTDIYLGPTEDQYNACADFYEECESILNQDWLKDCNIHFDMEERNTACSLELCGHGSPAALERAKQVMMIDYLNFCRELVPDRLDDSHEMFCDWPALSGFITPRCPSNLEYKACANKCAVTDCEFNLVNSCTGTEKFESLCVCPDDFIMYNNICIPNGQCPVGTWSAWNQWSDCQFVSGPGSVYVIERSRKCEDYGPCPGNLSQIELCKATCSRTKDCPRNEACVDTTCECTEGYERVGAECVEIYSLPEEIAGLNMLDQLDHEVTKCIGDFLNTNNINKLRSVTNKFSFFKRSTTRFLKKYHHIKFVVEKRKEKSGDACECIGDTADTYVNFFDTLDIDMSQYNVKNKIATQGAKVKRTLNQRGNCSL